nr:serine/threonine-protein kinase 35-like [Aegilops tauschii subsp. strangulata]
MSLLPPTISSLLVSFFPVSSSRQRPNHGHPHHAPRPGAKAAASRRAQGQGPLRPGARAGRREQPPGAKAAASRRAQEHRLPRAASPRGKGRRAQEHRLPRAARRAQEKRQRPARSSACTQPVEPPPFAWPAT